MKKCTKCQESKDQHLFSKDKRRKDGLSCWCKKCIKEYKSNNPDKVEKYRQNQKERKEYNPMYKNMLNEKNKEWRRNNPDKVKQYNKDYREKNNETLGESKYFL